MVGPSGLRAESELAGRPKGESIEPVEPRKAVVEPDVRPYRRPTLVGGGKYPKAFGRALVKELGKLTP